MLSFLENYIIDVTNSIEPLDISEVQYSQEFEAIENEIQKLQNVVPETPDWQLIIENGKVVLTTQGKHLKIITYIIVALYQKYKVGGLLAGLYIFSNILTQEKDAIMPYGKRKKSRINLITWMVKFIADYRDRNPQDLQLKDLDRIDQAKQDVISWFNEYHADDDNLALLQIYDWFLNAKKTLENEKRVQEQKTVLAQKEQERLKKEQEETLERQRQEQEKLKQEQEALALQQKQEQEDRDLAKTQSVENEVEEQDSSVRELAIEDLASVKEYARSELLDRLAFCKDNQDDLFTLLVQSRKILWNTIYYNDLYEEIIETSTSPDLAELNQILCISDPILKLGELEKLYIKNPFLLDIQMYMIQILDDMYMKSNDKSFRKISDFISIEIAFLISQFPNIFELSYKDRVCIPEYIYDWIFTQLVDDISIIREKFEEYIERYDVDMQYNKVIEYAKKAKFLNLKMGFLLYACDNPHLNNYSKINIIEKFVCDHYLVDQCIDNNTELREIFRNLNNLYEEYIVDTSDQSLIKRKEEIMKKISF
ncbi:type VI secretion system ImpA family N-terminal domain-containing protein [Francisella philomiragia]|uniref:type VI secretion system ImpA family N-terminal domain-containing protein n=1 Tax=Francisella philomiragia TaxID=28110 RepID=UPI001C9D8D44|nr:type VI secretion system ImpA family N-terminal domain-containing protein [Francisella philomiragia]MBY7735068.1 type VI secretion system ImpA family N-terminal domain-containing protein [Francisella philomiragia]